MIKGRHCHLQIMAAAIAALLTAPVTPVTAEWSATSTVFNYVDHLNHERISIFPPQDGKPGIYQFAPDAFAHATFCEEHSEYFCFKSDMNIFAVPKRLGARQDRWTYDGVTYKVIDTWKSITLLGQKIEDVSVIRVPSSATFSLRISKTDVDFLYSRTRGVVGIRFIGADDPKKTLFWLVEEKGFGAQP